MTMIAVAVKNPSARPRIAMRWMLMLACVACATVAVAGNAVAALPSVVRIAAGSVRGSGSDVVAFKGIPYAAPPMGIFDGAHRQFQLDGTASATRLRSGHNARRLASISLRSPPSRRVKIA